MPVAGVSSRFATRQKPARSCEPVSPDVFITGSSNTRQLKDDVAVVRLNDPTSKMGARVFVNMLSVQMQSELTDVMRKIWSNSSVKSAVLIFSNPGCFMAAADIR
ncbi:hypothetical protein PAMP_013932 [Pampus punctatissimus]